MGVQVGNVHKITCTTNPLPPGEDRGEGVLIA